LTTSARSLSLQIDGGLRSANEKMISCRGFSNSPNMNGGLVQTMCLLQAYEEGAFTGMVQDSTPGATVRFRALTNSSSRHQKALRRFAVKFSGSAA